MLRPPGGTADDMQSRPEISATSASPLVWRNISLEDFFRSPDKHIVRVSPDGTQLAWLEPWHHRLNVMIRDLACESIRRLTAVTERDILDLHWGSRNHIVYAQDHGGGGENFTLYAVDVHSGSQRQLSPSGEVKCHLIDELPEIENQILLQMNSRDRALFDAYRADVATGELVLAASNPGHVIMWLADHAGLVRVAVTTEGIRQCILYREDETEPWTTVADFDFRELLTPQCFTPDNQALYVISNRGRDKSAVFVMDLVTGRMDGPLYAHPEVDVSGTVYSPHRHRLVAAEFTLEKSEIAALDPEYASMLDYIDQALPGRENRITSASRDESVRVVHSRSDRTMGAYYLMTLPNHHLEKLFEVSPWLREQEMSSMRPISLLAREGLKLHGYLSLPPCGPSEDLPLVVMPHGGPWLRDSWCFNPEVQFLTNRGMAVLQINFRGSTGYGRAFCEAGFGQWGLAMQNDITDSVHWAIDSGLAAADRVAIYGASYGGYAALVGMVTTPELYACGVSYVGVSNLFTWIESIPAYWHVFLDTFYEMIGHPERDAERLVATSPLFHVDRIRAPLLLAHGVNDPRVPCAESDQMVAMLRLRGVPVEYIVKDGEGHGFQNEENRFEFYRAMEAFLSKYLRVPGDKLSRAAANPNRQE
jgi:dipeptidyl aminopeptidase/acylaminoacyl peptidase